MIEPKFLKDAEMYQREFHKDNPEFKAQRGYDPLWLMAYVIKRLKEEQDSRSQINNLTGIFL